MGRPTARAGCARFESEALRFSLPPGYCWDELGRIEMDPDERISDTLRLPSKPTGRAGGAGLSPRPLCHEPLLFAGAAGGVTINICLWEVVALEQKGRCECL